jgi:non-specific serine/threonine protein kinase
MPLRVSAFVGRERELDEVCREIEDDRLLSLVGTGGIGKTRLALEVAERIGGAYVDGVFVVDLSPLSQPELVVQAVAQALDLRIELDRHPQMAMLTFLRARQLLLVLDNCEHLVDVCAELVQAVLQNCPEVRVLATSREPLGVAGENVYRLGPLDEAAAIRLFVERARAQRRDFVMDDKSSVLQVCRALDHLPLAIELAAAWMGVLGPAELLPRLEDRFAVLRRTRGHGVATRHQTLLATVEWSYGLLNAAEQRLFRSLAVFAGPFNLDAATVFAGTDTLDVLAGLVDKSLVESRADERGHTRYRLLDTLRWYARLRLDAAGELEEARGKHVRYFLERAEALCAPSIAMGGPSRALDEQLDDLRGACEWCLAVDPQAGLRLIAATRDVWWRQSCAEGRSWAKAFLERNPAPSLTRARALLTAGFLDAVGDPTTAQHLLNEALAVAERVGDGATIGNIESCFGLAAFVAENTPDAVQHLERSLASFEVAGDAHGACIALPLLGWALLTEHGRREEGRHALERVHQLAQADQYDRGMADYGLGLYWRWTGHPARALEHFRKALAGLVQVEVAPGLSATLLHIARLLSVAEPVRAATLASAGRAADQRVGVHLAPRLLRATDQLRSELEQRLGADQLRRAWDSGERLSMREAVELALQAVPTPNRGRVLTVRQLELASLVARGLSSRQIGELLDISPRTVSNHLARIYTRLGLTSRLALATWLTQMRMDLADVPGQEC